MVRGPSWPVLAETIAGEDRLRVVAQEEIQLELSLGRMRGLLHDRSSIDAGGALLVRDVDALGRQSNLLLVAPTRKGCAVTRSFSDRRRGPRDHGAGGRLPRRGARRELRVTGLGANRVTVFFHTSEHDRDRPQRSVSSMVTLPEASNEPSCS